MANGDKLLVVVYISYMIYYIESNIRRPPVCLIEFLSSPVYRKVERKRNDNRDVQQS